MHHAPSGLRMWLAVPCTAPRARPRCLLPRPSCSRLGGLKRHGRAHGFCVSATWAHAAPSKRASERFQRDHGGSPWEPNPGSDIHHLHLSPRVRSKSQVLAILRGRGLHRSVNARRWGPWGTISEDAWDISLPPPTPRNQFRPPSQNVALSYAFIRSTVIYSRLTVCQALFSALGTAEQSPQRTFREDSR